MCYPRGIPAHKLNHHLWSEREEEQIMLMDSAILFGWNGSGKSNLIKAFKTLQGLVTDPNFTTTEKICHWGNDSGDQTDFEIFFSENEDLFQYNLSVVPYSVGTLKDNVRERGPYYYRIVRENLRVYTKDGQHIDFSGLFDITNTKMDETPDGGNSEVLISKLNSNALLKKRLQNIYNRSEYSSITPVEEAQNALINSSYAKQHNYRKWKSKMEGIENNIDDNTFEISILNAKNQMQTPLFDLRCLRSSANSSKSTGPEKYVRRAYSWFCKSLIILGTGEYILPVWSDMDLKQLVKII